MYALPNFHLSGEETSRYHHGYSPRSDSAITEMGEYNNLISFNRLVSQLNIRTRCGLETGFGEAKDEVLGVSSANRKLRIWPITSGLSVTRPQSAASDNFRIARDWPGITTGDRCWCNSLILLLRRTNALLKNS